MLRGHDRLVGDAGASRVVVLCAAWLLIIGAAVSIHHARVERAERAVLETAQGRLATARRDLANTIARRGESRTTFPKGRDRSGECAFPGLEDDGPRHGRAGAAAGELPLSKSDVVNGMNVVKPAIRQCYLALGVPGLALVNVVIGRDGRIAEASVVGKFARTPTGRCVEEAVRGATFPRSAGLSTPYPFSLRP